MFKYIFNKINLFSFLLLIFGNQIVQAQIDLGVPTIAGKTATTTLLKDYEAIGINPANLGFDNNNRFSIGIGYVNVNIQSKALNIHELTSSLKSMNSDENSSDNKFTDEFAKLFTCENGLNINGDVNILALSLHLGRLGGFALSMRDRIISHISADVTSQAMLDSLLKGGDNGPVISEVFNSAKVNIEYLREFNIAWGHKLNKWSDDLDIYGGVGYRYLLGFGNININADAGNIAAQTSLSSYNYKKFSDDFPGNLFNSDGHGFAFDFGASAIYKKKLKFGISVVDLGYIKWRSMVMEKANTTMLVADSLQKIVKTFEDLFNQDNLFNKLSTTTTSLPAKLRIGAGLRLTKHFEIGADVSVPLNQIYNFREKSYISFGGEFNFLNLFKVNTGIAGNPKFGWNIPLGITFSAAGFYDIYFATNDILTYLGHTKNPVLSFAVCAIRFNIPPRRIKNIVNNPAALTL